jgi:crotonobetainyl-CoA:carnitine CoA-transferase CaiB-like acyl-CoA transferase
VVVENFRPGVMAKFGLGYDAARQVNPRLIYASASGYGQDSPYRDLPGQDLLLQAVSGMAALTGRGEDLPTPAGAAVIDQHGAALLAMGILGALFHRERTGEGQRVEATMLQAALDLQSEPLAYYLNGGKLERPQKPLGSTFHPAPYGIYRTSDGFLALSLTPVATVRKALGGPETLAAYEDPKLAIEKRDEIWTALQPILCSQTTDHWLKILRGANVWCAPVLRYDQVFEDPAVRYLEPILEFDHPQAGRIRLVAPPVRYSAWQPRATRVPPDVGEDTGGVLKDLGYSPEDLAQLHRDGVIG